ncbi:CxxxxCH/CxxCH domain-containing protein [Rhizobium sp. Leaf311]|uniref:CxxxxCH/CxxCH domain-containing protein n=1 Tax=Rhizobium sp. Leaf311 TaxID=1736332 RepID=UPI0032981692
MTRKVSVPANGTPPDKRLKPRGRRWHRRPPAFSTCSSIACHFTGILRRYRTMVRLTWRSPQ